MPAGCILRVKVWTNLPSHFLAGTNLRNRGMIGHIVATIGIILSLANECVKGPQSRAYENDKLHFTNRSGSIAGRICPAHAYAVGSTPNTSVVVLWLS